MAAAAPAITPPPSTLYLVNESTLISTLEAMTIAAALDTQLAQHLCPAWGLAPMHVQFLPRSSVVGQPADSMPRLTLLDTLDDADALGYHTEDDGTAKHGGGSRVYGYAGVKAVLDQGAKVLTGAYSVASIASHEACELAVDRHCEQWSDDGQGEEVATEVCDPVQSDWYPITAAAGSVVSVSNFVLPDYFDPAAARGTRLDYMRNVTKPYGITKGGYQVRRADGRTRQVFGEQFPAWLRATKGHPHSRTQHRVEGRPRG